MTSNPIEPWYDRLVLRERFSQPVMGNWLVFSQIDYNDEVIQFVEVEHNTPAK